MSLFTAARSLSAKLLVLTVFFVMLAEVLIFVPSVSRFREVWLEERLAEAHLAAMSLEAAPNQTVSAALESKLLRHVWAHGVELILPRGRVYMLGEDMPPGIDRIYDLRDADVFQLIADALEVLAIPTRRAIKVIGLSPKDPTVRVEVVMEESHLRLALVQFAGRILALSVVISVIAASLVFFSLNWLLVRPMGRITASMMAFRRNPEDPAAMIVATGRDDEIGMAERELADMQASLRSALRQKERLAALGTAVAKINHDLGNILTTASVVSEHLATSGDPDVVRVTPRLMTALDRAMTLCTQTLSYTRDGVMPLRRSSFLLAVLIEELRPEVLAAERRDSGRAIAWLNQVADSQTVMADRDQLARALANLGRNALQAGANRVTVSAAAEPGRLVITVADDGPGLPPRARDNLFQPFAGSARAGGTGLGLAIAREVALAHGGDLKLVESTAAGTAFALDLPAGGMSR
ncbi:MAG: sensor histidine kinase [Azospirillum sp.]|nr:sensor histidine kinase [Azospirillum sp.]